MTNSLNLLFVTMPTIIKLTANNVNKYPIVPIKLRTIEETSNNIPEIKVIYEINFKSYHLHMCNY